MKNDNNSSVTLTPTKKEISEETYDMFEDNNITLTPTQTYSNTNTSSNHYMYVESNTTNTGNESFLISTEPKTNKDSDKIPIIIGISILGAAVITVTIFTLWPTEKKINTSNDTESIEKPEPHFSEDTSITQHPPSLVGSIEDIN